LVYARGVLKPRDLSVNVLDGLPSIPVTGGTVSPGLITKPAELKMTTSYIEILGYLKPDPDDFISKYLPSRSAVAYRYHLTANDLHEIRKATRWSINWWLSGKINNRSSHPTLARFSNVRDFHAVIGTWEKPWHHRINAQDYEALLPFTSQYFRD
jgi:hypothetical protein